MNKNYSDKLGHATWEFLYQYMNGYPSNPPKIIQDASRDLLLNLALSYPCEKCRNGFIQYIKKHFPNTHCNKCLAKYLQGMYSQLHK